MPAANSIRLVGNVAGRAILQEIGVAETASGFAKLVMHQLTSEDMLAIARAIHEDPVLGPRVEITLPRHFFPDLTGLPESLFTAEPITELRNKRCVKSARLMALVDDSQAQSLANVSKISRDSLLRRDMARIWLEEAVKLEGSSLPDEALAILEAAFVGLFVTDRASLRACADYVIEVVTHAKTQPPVYALGASLWCLRVPNLVDAFSTLKSPRPSEFQRAFLKHFRNDCYLLKRDPKQAPYTRQTLETMFTETEAQLLPIVRDIVREFIQSPDGWTPVSEALAKLDWSEVRKFFEGSPKAHSQTLGERTEELFKQLDADRFDAEDWTFVSDLKVRGAKAQRTDADTEFYHKRIREIQEDNALAAAWERFIYGGESRCTDFRAGLLECAHRLRKERTAIEGEPIMEVIGIESEKLRLRRKNPAACRYFEMRFAHLQQSLRDAVRFRKCEAFGFSAIEAESKDREKPHNTASRKANQLSFRVRLVSKTKPESSSTEIRLIWEFRPQSVLNGYAGDLTRLVKYADYHKAAPLVSTLLDLNPKSSRSGQYTFTLADISAIQSPKRTELGALVPAVMSTANLADDWKSAVASAQEKGFLTPEAASRLDGRFAEFCAAYTTAIKALRASQFDASTIELQAARWACLLSLVSREVKAESPRGHLLRPLLRLGLACIQHPELTSPVAVVCPWHPLRMQSTVSAEARFAEKIVQLVKDDRLAFSDVSGNLFLNDTRLDLGTSGLPEVALVWRGDDPVLLAQSDELAEYSLLEPPTSAPHSLATTNENPARTAKQISEIARSFLELQPHERDNFSIVLYNCDSKTLPGAVVESISASDEDAPGEATCQIILTHQERPVLASLYEAIAAQEGDDDAFYVSESSRDFMSRVRINISVDHGVPQHDDENYLTDIVFCQDVISRHADPSREPVPRACTEYPKNLVLHHWSRKRQLVVGDNNSVVYLTCPAQTQNGWEYLHALAVLKDRDYAERVWQTEGCLIPARKLNFDKPETTRIFADTHALGNWVVNFDELLDRRILRHRNVQVIRYRQSSVGGRNLIISSKAKDTLLRATLHQKLSSLVPAAFGPEEKNTLVTAFIDEANEISGNLVLRAARRGANANELIGLVLSHHLVRTEFPPNQTVLCFLLDDYAEWLGQTEERIADLILLAPIDGLDGKHLDVVITEAKFVRFEQAAAAAKESGRQLHDSLVLLERALLSDVPCIDQDLWLARLSDLLLEGIQNLGQNLDVPAWRSAIRNREFRLSLRGQSHVFIHAPAELETEGRKFSGIKGCSGQQEVFDRCDVKTIIASFAEKSSTPATVKLRLSLSGMPPGPKSYRAIPGPTLAKPGQKDNPPGEPDNPPAPMAPPEPSSPPSRSSPSAPVTTGRAAPAPSELIAGSGTVAFPTHNHASEDAWVAATTQKVRHALLKRELSAEILQAKGTPNALLLQFKGSDRLTVGLLEAQAGELRTTDGIDIINIRPGLGTVILMVARPDRRVLSLAEAWCKWAPSNPTGNTEILIAIRENDNEPLYLSPYPQPHTLVAGTTGSGKSVLIQNIILGIAATNTPEQAELVIIDPKQGLDYLGFEKLPHLSGDIVTNPDEAIASLAELVGEMESRYRTFREHRVQNIDDYLKKDLGALPRLWVIHDEFGDWTQNKEYANEVASLVNRLGQKARAAGIYLVFAAQRPDNTIFPMVLRSNLANRLVLKVDSVGTSEIATGTKNAGAERLLGSGHLLAILGNLTEPTYAQVPYVETAEIERIVESINRKYPR
jgi:S-DNA-T family DNA segregation ATPase FtsK/SpoIIIE